MTIDLSAYWQTLLPYEHKIHLASTPANVSKQATEFLNQIGSRFDKDISSLFFEEAAYLWSTFPNRTKTLEKYKELAAVLLRQMIDSYWYAHYPRYSSDADVEKDATLCSFKKSSEEFHVKFSYVQYYQHTLMRIPNSLRLRYRRIANHPGKYTQGLTTTRCKKATAALINQIVEDIEDQLRAARPLKVLINSILRTVEYQHTLSRIGYIAPRSSSHLAGYAVDMEQRWYAEHDPRLHNVMHEVLHRLFQSQIINLIDEGTHWHICLNPQHIHYFEALFQKWAEKRRYYVWDSWNFRQRSR